MRIVTWNMGCATRHYCSVRDEAWRLLLSLEPDVLLLQEAMLDAPAFARDAGTFFAHPATPGATWGSAVLVRGAKATAYPFDVPGTFAAAAEIAHPRGPILVASLHVCPGPHLARNVAALASALPPVLTGRAFVIGGDLNSCRHFDAVYRRKTHARFLAAMDAAGAHDCYFSLHGREIQSYWGRAREA